MKKFLLWLLLPPIVLLLAGCDQLETGGGAKKKTVYVGPEMVDCEAESPRTCFLVKEIPDEQWRVWYDAIEGFQFEPGYEYELIVSENEVEDPATDGASVIWTLQEIVEKVPVTAAVSEATSETPTTGESESPMASEGDAESPAELEFVPIQMEDLGISTVVPADWPKIEDDPLLQDAWGPGQYRFIAFNSVGGDDVSAAMAQLLSTTVEELRSGTIDGEYWEETIGDHNWGMYAVDNPNVDLAQTVSMVERDGTIYVVSLFIETDLKDAVLIPVLQNFAISSVAAADKTTMAEVGPPTLIDTEWELQAYSDDGGQMINLLPDSEITTLFAADGRVSGFAGCNDFVSLYTVEDENLTINFPALTRQECADPPGIMLQETSFLADLVVVAAYELQGNELRLLNDKGEAVLSYSPLGDN